VRVWSEQKNNKLTHNIQDVVKRKHFSKERKRVRMRAIYLLLLMRNCVRTNRKVRENVITTQL
jgi:hypothetical protein